jgi:CheY-like chemotaxis protein
LFVLPPPESPVGTAGNILLIEEYSALATAFRALLQKAAPEHATHVVISLAEAETSVRAGAPDLLVIDVDPPPRGAVAFFNRLKAAAPDLRVLVIGAEDAGKLVEEPNGPAAFHFIKKPFEVDRFGVVVRGLLDPSPGHARTLREMGLADLLVLHAVASATAVLQVSASDGRSGEIHFRDGRITHALVVGHTGAAALHEILRWRAPRVREVDRRTDAPRTIGGPWNSVLREALRFSAREQPSSTGDVAAQPSPRPQPSGKKLLIVDDTELLLVFAEEVLSTAEPTLNIVTASSGLAGLEKAIAEKPDLILLDYSLPDITGDEVCRRLLADERTMRVPVIMMSGHVPEMLAVAETYDNVIAAIPKPFLSTALVELIERTLAELPKIAARRRKRAKASAAAPPKKPPERKPPGGTNSHNEEHSNSPPPTEEPTDVPPTSPAGPSQEAEPSAAPAEPPPPPPELPPSEGETTPPANQLEPERTAPAEVQPEVAPPIVENIPAPLPEVKPPAPAPAEQTPPKAVTASDVTRAVMQGGSRNLVVLTIPLEVVSMQFSPSLQMRAIRGRPVSPTVSLHILPHAVPGGVIPEARFDLARVNLDARGQIDTIRVAPTTRAIAALSSENAVTVVGIGVLLANGGTAMELMPAPAAPMRMQLTALFELSGVELSPGFRVAHLVLKWRGGNMHVSQQATVAGGSSAGLTFETAQVLLDRSGRIAEILLDAPA